MNTKCVYKLLFSILIINKVNKVRGHLIQITNYLGLKAKIRFLKIVVSLLFQKPAKDIQLLVTENYNRMDNSNWPPNPI